MRRILLLSLSLPCCILALPTDERAGGSVSPDRSISLQFGRHKYNPHESTAIDDSLAEAHALPFGPEVPRGNGSDNATVSTFGVQAKRQDLNPSGEERIYSHSPGPFDSSLEIMSLGLQIYEWNDCSNMVEHSGKQVIQPTPLTTCWTPGLRHRHRIASISLHSLEIEKNDLINSPEFDGVCRIIGYRSDDCHNEDKSRVAQRVPSPQFMPGGVCYKFWDKHKKPKVRSFSISCPTLKQYIDSRKTPPKEISA